MDMFAFNSTVHQIIKNLELFYMNTKKLETNLRGKADTLLQSF